MTKLIAEIGLNYCGSLKRAIDLTEKAINCGVDFVKFQYFNTENLFHKEIYSKILNIKEDFDKNIEKLLLNDDDFVTLLKYCIDKNIKFGISFFSKDDLINLKNYFINKYNFDLFTKISFLKVASGEINDLPLLSEYIKISKNYNLPILISVGATNDREIKFILNFFKNIKKNIVLLHCRIKYPADFENFNLKRIKYLRDKYKIKTGISDHSIGIEIPLLSLYYNPEYIEKHFSDSRDIKEADNFMSTNEEEFKKIKFFITNFNNIIGNGSFNLLKNEYNEIKYARKGIYFKESLNKNKKITEEKVFTLRPNLLLNDAFYYYKILNKKLKKDKNKLEPINIKEDI
jgi:sialic acid synthase SpsE